MIVTIDGPAGAGKSTVARQLAQRLGFERLDTGATYRMVALALSRLDHDADVTDAFLHTWLPSLHLRIDAGRMFLNGEDVTVHLRTPVISSLASEISTRREVRLFLSDWQRRYAVGRDLVSEGRDQGTVVFPHAACKFFVTAQPLARAQRRFLELSAQGVELTLEQVAQEQAERDQRDEQRALAPLQPAPDAVLLDTTFLTLDQVVETMETRVRQRLHAAVAEVCP